MLGLDRILREIMAQRPKKDEPRTAQPVLPHLTMPDHHDVRPKDVMARRLHGNLAAAADRGPADFKELLQAKLSNEEELAAIRRLDEQARRLEAYATGPSIEKIIADERLQSHSYGGWSVFGWEPMPEKRDIR